jgi:diguanylate cyclase (GGDEF)-like protein
MGIETLSSRDLRAAVSELDLCFYNHEQWLDALMGTLICDLPPDARDLDRDSHHNCRLGQWYYSDSEVVEELAKRPGFTELGMEHQRMHQHAANMLQASLAGKPVPVREFQRFTNALKNMRLEISTLKQDIEDMLHAIDPLTGVPGRLGMLTRLREQQALVERDIQSCCLAMMDLDHFKYINDEFGHVAGDGVLVASTEHMTQSLRPYDKVFRYGGEEFVIVMPDTTVDDGFAVIERLREGLAALPHALGPEGPVYVTASFGLAALEIGVSVENSIDRADKALYAAKAAGRNRCIAWTPQMSGTATPSLRTAI